MVDDNQDLMPRPLRIRLGWCQFCGSAVQEVKFEPLGDGCFRYTNDCACLHSAVLVVEDDGCYYWAMISPAARPADTRAQTTWEKWQARDLNNLSPGAPLSAAADTPSEPPAGFDAHLYEEAQIILSMYG